MELHFRSENLILVPEVTLQGFFFILTTNKDFDDFLQIPVTSLSIGKFEVVTGSDFATRINFSILKTYEDFGSFLQISLYNYSVANFGFLNVGDFTFENINNDV